MRVCAGITYMVIGEAPDMSSVVEDVRHRWSSPSIDTTPREAHAKKQKGPRRRSESGIQIGFVRGSETSAALGLNGSRSPAISSSILAALSSLQYILHVRYTPPAASQPHAHALV